MPSRRTVLKAVAAAGAAAVFTGTFGGLRAAYAAGVRTRRSLHGMSLDDPDLVAWRDFVNFMQLKEQNQLVSWLGFSLQHGNQNAGYKYCPHGDWYFLPWHREYVLMYERAVQALTLYKNFAMPYWDWTTDRTIPAAFTDPTYKDRPNPLYVSSRTLNTKNWPLADSVVGPQVLKQIFSANLFQEFGTSRNPKQNNLDMSWVVRGGGAQRALEGTAHNLVHNYIGGFMPSPGSPRDPIFFMHHGNIDRIWWWWNTSLGNQNTAGMTADEQTWWLDMFYKDNYVTPDGKFYGVKTRDVQSAQALGYTYDKGFPEFSPKKRAVDPERAKRMRAFFDGGVTAAAITDAPIVLDDQNTDGATFDKPLVKSKRFPKEALAAVQAKSETRRAPEVFAMLRNIQVPDAVSSIRVFVNADNVTADTPTTDPHFVTEIGFLQHPGGHGGDHADKEPPSSVIDLTPTLTALSSAGLLKDDTITLQIIAVPREGAAAGEKPQVVPAAVEIAVL